MDWLENERLRENFGLIILMIVLGFIYLVSSLAMDYKVAQLALLQKQLDDLKAKYSYVAVELNRFTLRSNVKKKVKELNLNLVFPDKPPKKIIIKN